ncbi:MAG: NADH-quinone oxidoreductase subunit NuoB [Myxococcota bacterium]
MLPLPMEVFTPGTQAGESGASIGASIGDPMAAAAVRATRLEAALAWAAALAPSPLRLATSCCGMAMAQGGDFFEQLGSAPPAASGRAADLLIVAGSITRRQLPSILELHARMAPPRWVMAWGACAISGGEYANYATISGLSRILPVDVVVPGCPPPPQALRDALESLRTGALAGWRRASSGAPGQPIGEAGRTRDDAGDASGDSFRAFEPPLRRSEGE